MSILDTFFDKIFVINLDSRKDRWEECQELFKKYGEGEINVEEGKIISSK